MSGYVALKGCFLPEPKSGHLLPLVMQGCCVLTKISEKPLLGLTALC